MIRTVIQWLIAQKIDNGISLGGFLSWVVRHDRSLRQYYESLLKLDKRLRRDAVALLEEASRTPQKKPLRVLDRSVRLPFGGSSLRRHIQKTLPMLILSTVFVFGAGPFFFGWIFPIESTGSVVASQPVEAVTVTDTTTLNDPVISDELIRLCRQSPNESGPFFIEPLK